MMDISDAAHDEEGDCEDVSQVPGVESEIRTVMEEPAEESNLANIQEVIPFPYENEAINIFIL
jgi:hypothetical protein